MKIIPITAEKLPEGTIIVLKESAVSWLGNIILPRRLRKVVSDRPNSILTHSLDRSNYGEWDRSDVEGYIAAEDIDKFIMWEILEK